MALGALNHLGHWHGTWTRPLIYTSWHLLQMDEAKTQKQASEGGASTPIHPFKEIFQRFHPQKWQQKLHLWSRNETMKFWRVFFCLYAN